MQRLVHLDQSEACRPSRCRPPQAGGQRGLKWNLRWLPALCRCAGSGPPFFASGLTIGELQWLTTKLFH